jgi:predicted ATP-dependent endonuclease of OLD family
VRQNWVVRLKRVEMENFRAFRHAEMGLPDDGLVLLAGANNSGKSALLSAYDVIAGNAGDTAALRACAEFSLVIPGVSRCARRRR